MVLSHVERGVAAVVSAASILAFRRMRSHGRGARIAAAALPLLATAAALPLATPTIVATDGAPGALVVAFRGVVVLSQAALWAAFAASHVWLAARTPTAGERSLAVEPDAVTSLRS